MRGYLVILLAVVGIACGQAATPTAPGSVSGQSTGFFTNGPVQLSYRLDVPAHSAPIGAVVFGHGSGLATKTSCRFLADPFLSRGFATLCFDKRGVGQLNVPGLWLLGGEDRSIPTPATVAILDELIASGRPYTHVVFPGFGHNLDAAKTWPEIDQWLTQTVK